MGRDINQVLIRFEDERVPLNQTSLYALNDLDRAERDEFRAAWSRLGVPRRRELAAALLEVAEDNIDVSFNAVFRVALNDEDELVRTQAVRGLWEDENPNLIGPLMRLLTTDPSEDVRAEAATALGKFVLQGELGTLDDNQAFAVQEALLRAHGDPSEAVDVRRRTLESLSYSSDEAMPDLIESAYKDADDRMVASAIFAMGRSADSRWERTVRRELRRSSPEIRFEAARALGELEAVEAVYELGEMAQTDADEQVREMCIHALGQIGSKESQRILETMAETEDNEKLQEAIGEALDEIYFMDDALEPPPFFGPQNGFDLEGDDEDEDEGEDDGASR